MLIKNISLPKDGGSGRTRVLSICNGWTIQQWKTEQRLQAIRHYLIRKDYGRLFLKVDHYSSLRSRFVFLQNLTVGYITSDNPFLTNGFQLGGVGENLINQVSFYGLNDTEIKTGSVASLQLGLQYKLAKSVYLTGRVNVALYNFHNQFDNLSASNNFLSGYALTFGFDSAIGPIEITSMYCDQDGSLRTNLNLGFRFLNQ